MEQSLENISSGGSEKIIGPFNFMPFARIDLSTNTLVISEENPPDVCYQKREWGITDWFNYLFLGEKAAEKIEVYHYKPSIERCRLEQVSGFRIEKELCSLEDSQQETTRYFVHYWQKS